MSRAPVGGRVMARRYTKGRFVNASLDKASLDNERLAIRMGPAEMPEIAFVLIAGLVARRIVCPVYEGQLLAAGERIGLIRFGSRVDVYVPPPYLPLVALGQRMVGGTVADLNFKTSGNLSAQKTKTTSAKKQDNPCKCLSFV